MPLPLAPKCKDGKVLLNSLEQSALIWYEEPQLSGPAGAGKLLRRFPDGDDAAGCRSPAAPSVLPGGPWQLMLHLPVVQICSLGMGMLSEKLRAQLPNLDKV